MTIYVVNLAIVILLGNLLCRNKQYGKKAFMILVCLQLILLCGLRADTVGRDTYGYVCLYFDKVMQTPLNAGFFAKFPTEKGFYLLTKLISFLSTDYTLWFIVVAAIPIILICLTVYKYSKDVVLSMAVFIALRPYAFLFTGLKQGIALGICFYSYRYIVEKKFFPFIACVLLAATFHRSSAIFILAYFLSRIRLDKKGFTMAILIGTISLVAIGPLLSKVNYFILKPLNVYSNYAISAFKSEELNSGLSTVILYTILLIYGLVNRQKIIDTNKNADAIFGFIYLSVIFYLSGLLGSILYRIAMYFGWFIILFLPDITNIFKEGKDRFIFKYVLYSVLFAQFLYFGPGFSLVPYVFFWQ